MNERAAARMIDGSTSQMNTSHRFPTLAWELGLHLHVAFEGRQPAPAEMPGPFVEVSRCGDNATAFS